MKIGWDKIYIKFELPAKSLVERSWAIKMILHDTMPINEYTNHYAQRSYGSRFINI